MSECIFCAIVRGELPASRVYEDEHTLAFMDLRQPNPGHVLVICKQHADMVYELDDEQAGAVFRTAAKVARAVKAAYQPDGLNLWQSNGRAAGQEVPHFHIHVFARKQGDELFKVYNYPPPATPREALEEMAERIRASLDGRG